MLALSLAGLLLHQPGPEPPRAAAITWEVPRECGDRAALRRAIARRLGRALAPGELTLVGRIDELPGSPRFQLRLELTVAGRTQVRTLTDERCPPLVDATALLVAVSVAPADPPPSRAPFTGPLEVRTREPERAPDIPEPPPPRDAPPPGVPPAPPAEPPSAPAHLDAHEPAAEPPPVAPASAPAHPDANKTSAEPPPAAPPSAPAHLDAPKTSTEPAPAAPPSAPAHLDAPSLPAPAPSPRARRRPGALVRLHGGPEYGAVPGPTGALGLAGGLLWKRARLELQGTWLAPQSTTRNLSSVQVSLLTAAAHGCARLGRGRVEFPLCGGLEFGGSRGRGRGPGARTATGAWLAGVVSAGVAWHAHRLLSVSLALQGVAPVVWPRFEVRDTQGAFDLFEARPVTARLLAGLEVRLGDPW